MLIQSKNLLPGNLLDVMGTTLAELHNPGPELALYFLAYM
jgi:hypothetical protein